MSGNILSNNNVNAWYSLTYCSCLSDGGAGVFVDFEANASSINSVPNDELIGGEPSSCFLGSSDFEAVEVSSFILELCAIDPGMFCILYLLMIVLFVS